jgi:hypothetical protein
VWIDLVPSNKESAAAILPLEALKLACFVQPALRSALDVAHRRENFQGRREGERKANMVVHSPSSEGLHAVIARNTSHVGSQA